MLLLDNMNWLIRISIAFAFAAFWGYIAYDWHLMGEAGPGRPTVIGMAVLSALAALGGFIGLVRMVTSTAKAALPERTIAEDNTSPPSDFDPDEVMARYIAQREVGGVATGATAGGEPGEPAPQPQRPQFGRKQV
jgi:hypothetical protein